MPDQVGHARTFRQNPNHTGTKVRGHRSPHPAAPPVIRAWTARSSIARTGPQLVSAAIASFESVIGTRLPSSSIRAPLASPISSSTRTLRRGGPSRSGPRRHLESQGRRLPLLAVRREGVDGARRDADQQMARQPGRGVGGMHAGRRAGRQPDAPASPPARLPTNVPPVGPRGMNWPAATTRSSTPPDLSSSWTRWHHLSSDIASSLPFGT